MGVCESNNSNLSKNRINIIKNGNLDSYKFECNMRKNLPKRLNLEFIFSQLKVKHCISHNSAKNSVYITEVSVPQMNNYSIIVNQGKSPVINPSYIFKINREFTIKELENLFFVITIYEFVDEIDLNAINKMNKLSEEYKSKSNYKSTFSIDLFSFLFKSKKCDFLMKGTNGLSSNTRICFNCEIIHRGKIKIYAKGPGNVNKFIFKTKNINLGSSKTFFDDFSLDTPLITMKELSQADIFLELYYNENIYFYTTLDDLKYKLIKKLGEIIINREIDYKELNSNKQLYSNANINLNYNMGINSNNNDYNAQLGNNNQEIKRITEQKNDAYIIFENLPIITQISCLYFTEYGPLYNTSFLHLINNDTEIQNYRKNLNISSEDFYLRLKDKYDYLNGGKFDFYVLFEELNDIFKRSIDTEKFYFLYPDFESLNKMIIIIMKIGIIIIDYIKIEKDEGKLFTLLKTIQNIIKREEIDNAVLNYCLGHFQGPENNLKTFINDFFLKLLKLNEYCRAKKMPNLNNNLVEIYSKLYFTKKFIRETIFNTLFQKETIYNINQIDVFIYDIINDEKLYRYFDQNAFNQIIKKKAYFSNLFSENLGFFKYILYHLDNLNINEFPLDFTQFIDNNNLLTLLGKYIKNKKMENLENDFFELTSFLCGSFGAISVLNENLIKYTNGYNNLAIFKLFEYLKSLLESYYKKEGCKLIMDYTILEKAINIIIEINSSIALPKLFWFYYCCSHLVMSSHLKTFIINVCNKSFESFAYHWSFSVRQVFFKLLIFSFNDKLKNEEGKFLNMKNIINYENKNVNKKILYKEESLKDYELINKEYKVWKELIAEEKTENPDLPIFFLPSPISPDKID